MSSSALNLGILQAKISNIQNAADSSTVYSGGVWSFKNSSAVTSVTISNAGVVTIGPSIANNYTGKAHVISGGLTSGNVTSTNASGRLYITNNCNIFDHTATSRTDTVTSGSGISLDNGTANGNAAFAVYANLTGDALDADASNIGFATYAGAWTLGISGANIIHLIQGTSADNDKGILDIRNFSATDAAPGCRIGTASSTDSTANKILNFLRGSSAAGAVVANGAGGATFGAYSDVRLKENFRPLESQLDKLLALNLQRYDLKSGSKNCVGITAQDMQKVFPESVSVDESTEEKLLMIGGWEPTTFILVKAIQELSAKVDAQAAEIEALKAK